MAGGREKKKNLKDTTSVTILRLGRRLVRVPRAVIGQVAIAALTAAAILLIFPYTSAVQLFQLPNEGEVSTETIIAPFTFDILKSPDELEKERAQAREDVLLVCDYDGETLARVRRRFAGLRESIRTALGRNTPDSLKSAARTALARELSENTVRTLLRRPYLLDDAQFYVEQVMDMGIMSVLLVPGEARLFQLRAQYNVPFESYLIYDKNFVNLRKNQTETTVRIADITVKEIALDRIVDALKTERTFDQEALSALYEVLYAYCVPNVNINGEETARRRQKAWQDVKPFKGKVIKDSEIIRAHQVVTPEILAKLRSLHDALGKNRNGADRRRVLSSNTGKVLLVLLFLFFIAGYISLFHPSVAANTKHLAGLAAILVVQLGLIRVIMLILPRLFSTRSEMTSIVPELLVPTAVAAILVTILFDIRLSFVVTLFVSIFFGIVTGFNHALFMYSLLGGVTAGFAARNIRYRWDFFRAIPPAALVCGLYILLYHMMLFKLTPPAMLQNMGLGLLNCIAATFFAMMTVTVFEYLFDITTDMTLVELSDMNHPLLKQLSIEAAGTYNHSVLVANLAESAAAKINANPLLARVASYYHDIGKINRPGYFVENQLFDKNIHDKLSPNMSALIISSHVQNGLEMARKNRLPTVIQSAIAQHHGTSKVSFFYEKALEQDPHKQVQEEDFRYPGPRPQSRENAIIMLADSVEAASRSIAKSSPKLLRELVKKIIHDKFASSQLDECDLTFQDLDRIIEGFMPVLQGIFHTRIEYPTKK